jgi:hypothetical protein
MKVNHWSLLILALYLSQFSAKLVFVSEYARHGAISPGDIFNFTKRPEDNFRKPYELDERGKRQHYLIGAEMRHRYIEKEPLISKYYNSSEVFFRSSNLERTLESTESQLMGLYPPYDCKNKLNDFQQKNARPPFEFEGLDEMIAELGEEALPDCYTLPPIFSRNNHYDYKLSIHHANCPTYKIVQKDLMRSRKLQKIQEPMVAILRPKFKKWIGEDIEDNNMLLKMCKYLVFATYHEVEFKFDFTLTDYTNCLDLVETQLFYYVWGNDLLWKIGGKRYLEHLVDAMDRVINGTQTEKFEINVSHEMSLSLVLFALGYELKSLPPFASTVIFELRSRDDNENEYYVKTLYNDVPIKFDMCIEYECDYETFKKNIRQRIIPGDIFEI